MSWKLAQLNLSETVRRNKLWISYGLVESLKAASLTIFKPLYYKLTVFIWSSSGGQKLLIRLTLWCSFGQCTEEVNVLFFCFCFLFFVYFFQNGTKLGKCWSICYVNTQTHKSWTWFERLNGAEEHSHICTVHGQN